MAVTFLAAPVDVVNEALAQLGKDPIADLDNADDPVAVKAKDYFGSLLRSILRDHWWNFARAQIALAQNVTGPVADFAYSYGLPVDCFLVRKLNGSDKIKWRVMGRNLETDETSAIIDYTVWVDDPNKWPGDFYQAFVTLLAVRLAPAFHSDVAKASDLFKVYQAQLADAKATDGQEGSQEQMENTTLTDDIRE